MRVEINPARETWKELCQRPQLELDYLESVVNNVIGCVKKSGDEALLELTKQYDGVALTNLAVTTHEVSEAIIALPESLKQAIKQAAANIEMFHAAQRTPIVKIETIPGVTCWRKQVPIQRVGIYIPGGSAPLFSTVLMLGIPAKIAGCKDVVLCTPPLQNGSIHPAILYAASLAGITKIYKVGGAQAIAAMAFGTNTITQVDKIFGPGNQYVTKAKQLINQLGTAIDMPAGPSEVLVIADKQASATFIGADLLSQAEHGADSQVVLVTKEAALVMKTQLAMEEQLFQLPRHKIAREALKNSLAVVFSDDDQIIDFVNLYAPEHLIINTQNAEKLSEQITNAGSIFLGAFTPESVGDYASGTNHTLPTNGYARAYSGVSLDSFMKFITIQKLTQQGLELLGPIVEEMAEAEQLKGHAHAVRVRINKTK